MNQRTRTLLDSLGINVDPSQQLGSCSIAVQQMVAIARAVDMDCSVLILDEPTSSLDENETAKLFGLMKDLKRRGVGMIFVTHFLDQVYEVCDRITVLRDGQLVGEYDIAEMPRVQLVSKMLGKELDDMADIKNDMPAFSEKGGTPLYEARGLCSNQGIKPFDFHIRKGEVNGFTGLLGSGRSECVRAIFGADKVTGGTVKMEGKNVNITKPIEAMKNGIAYLPEDRKRDGIICRSKKASSSRSHGLRLRSSLTNTSNCSISRPLQQILPSNPSQAEISRRSSSDDGFSLIRNISSSMNRHVVSMSALKSISRNWC